MKYADWLISDLIPKKSEKFEFRKIFLTIFFSVKNWPRKTKFWLFSPTQFSKKCKIIFKICRWDNYLKNGKFWKKLIFFRNQRKILSARHPLEKVFGPWVKSYETFSIFRTLSVPELVIYIHQIYRYISNQNFTADSKKFKIFESAYANF